MFPAARLALRLRLALWVRLTLRLWRVLHTRHALSAAGIRGWTAALDPRFPVGAWRTGVNGALSLRAALDTRFPVGTGVEPLSALRRSALDPRFSMTAASERGCIRCRSRRRGEGRDAVIHRRKLRTLEAGRALMSLLDRRQSNVPFVARQTVLRRRRRDNAAGATVVTHARRTGIDGDILHIRIANVGGIDVVARSVVVKTAAVPVATDVADAEVAEPIIDPAVEAYARTPITRIPDVVASIPAPVSRRP